MARRVKFPQTVFVHQEIFDNDDPILVITDTAEECAEIGKVVPVAEYELVRTVLVQTDIEVR